jgi:hypothetical protein
VDEYGRLIAAWQQAPKGEKLNRTEKTPQKKKLLLHERNQTQFLVAFLKRFF